MRSLGFVLVASSIALVSTACGDGAQPTPVTATDTGTETAVVPDTTPAGGPTTLSFEARVGAAPFSCAKSFADLGTSKTTIEPLDFRVYLHDVRLVRADATEVAVELEQDGVWQFENLVLLDFEDKTGTCLNGTAETNTVIKMKTPAGSYTGVKFKVGVPFALNHANAATAPSPLNLSGLFWTWNSGYKFTRMDFKPKGAGAFNLHLGSTGCVGEASSGGVKSCSNPNRGEVALTFDPSGTKKIIVDLGAVLEGIDLSKDGGGAPGCMAAPTDPECVAIFPKLGVDPTTGAASPSSQKLFRVE